MLHANRAGFCHGRAPERETRRQAPPKAKTEDRKGRRPGEREGLAQREREVSKCKKTGRGRRRVRRGSHTAHRKSNGPPTGKKIKILRALGGHAFPAGATSGLPGRRARSPGARAALVMTSVRGGRGAAVLVRLARNRLTGLRSGAKLPTPPGARHPRSTYPAPTLPNLPGAHPSQPAQAVARPPPTRHPPFSCQPVQTPGPAPLHPPSAYPAPTRHPSNP